MSFNQKEYNRNYYLKNRERIIARTTAYQLKHKKKRASYKRNWHLKRSYRIDQIDYNKLYDKQKGLCAVCKQPESKLNSKTNKPQPLCVDHDHKTNKVRGLLCCRCNRSVGLLGDSLHHIQSVVRYLKRYV